MSTQTTASLLHVSGLRKSFGEVRALQDVSFDVHRGEVFGLLGPNGAGKTTTIRSILNILEPDGGTITFDGKPFDDSTRNIVGYLPEERGLYRKSRLLDTILYFAELRGVPRAQGKAEAMVWLERFGLARDIGRKIEELSKGNQQKIQFITAVIQNPSLLILDEPFSGLDPVNQLLFKDILLELRAQGKAIIFSTHQMDQAEKLSDALCLINQGRVVLSGSVREVKKKYGTNTLHLEFEGDGRFLETLRGVTRALVFGNSAELDLAAGTKVSDLIGEVNGKIELRRLELLEPSLNSIFIQMVGGANKEAAV